MADQTYTLTISGEDAQRLSRLVESGKYETPEAAVAEALAELEFPADTTLDGWLTSVVAKRYDAYIADPSRGVSLEEARMRLRDR